MNRPASASTNIYIGLFLILIGFALAVLYGFGVFDWWEVGGFNLRQAIVSPLHNSTSFINNMVKVVGDIQAVRTENSLLKEQNTGLHSQLAELEQLQDENRFLRGQLHLGVKTSKQAQLAKVIRYEYFPQPGVIYVEMDNASVARIGDWAVSDGYIVGKVARVFGQFAKIQLISSPGFEVSVRVGANQDLAKLVARTGGTIAVAGIQSSKKIAVGSPVKLLQAGNVALEKYIFGYTTTASSSDSDAELSLDLSTPIDLNNLDFLLLLPERDV